MCLALGLNDTLPCNWACYQLSVYVCDANTIHCLPINWGSVNMQMSQRKIGQFVNNVQNECIVSITNILDELKA